MLLDKEDNVLFYPMLYTDARGAKEAEEIAELLKENGISAYHQNAAGGVTVHSMSGFSLYGVDIFVDEADAEKAKRIAGR